MTDLFIVGGGPAGLAAAIAARHAGLRVTLADSRFPPIDKACGEGLMPETVTAARQLGITLPSRRFEFRGVRFHGDGTFVEADFPRERGCGVRRTELHECLAEQAANAGVELRWGKCVQSLDEIDAKWILGADGAASLVRQWSGLGRTVKDVRRFGYRLHFSRAPWTDHLEIYWGEGFQLYVTPVACDEVSVALISRDSKLRVREAMSRVPILAERFAGVPAASAERGAITASRKLHHITRRNVALLGDASGTVDAITGEGLGLAFRQAHAFAAAVANGDLRQYEAAHTRLQLRPRFMAEFMLTMDRWSWLRKRALPCMARRPEIFGGLLAMHVGEATWGGFGWNCARLGYEMARSL